MKGLPEDTPRWRNARVGKFHDRKLAKVAQCMLRYADLIYIALGEVWIVEFKVKPNPGAVGQLKAYAQEFPKTVEFEAYKNLPIRLRLICTHGDKVVEAQCRTESITFEVFRPHEWIREHGF